VIRARLSSGRHPARHYLLQDAAGRVLAGNLPPPERTQGWITLRIPAGPDEEGDDPSDDAFAHDLRTPLTRLRQRLEAARAGARTAEETGAAIDEAIGEVDELLGTFSALLRIAQIESGTRRAGFAAVDLSAVFRKIADAYAPVAEDQGQSLDIAVADGVSYRGDRQLLEQLLANLVENALRHTPPGASISLSLQEGPSGPLGVVADTGPGIPEHARAKVFQPFYRLETSRSTPGSGLGLALVAAIADLHRIRVDLSNNEPGLKVSLGFGPPADAQELPDAGSRAS